MRVRRVCDRSTLFLLYFALYWTNQPFLNGRHHRSFESTNWPPKCDSTLNILPPRRDFLYPPSHFRSTHKAAGILLHSTSNYSNKDVLFFAFHIAGRIATQPLVRFCTGIYQSGAGRKDTKDHAFIIPTAPPLSTWN